jgi:hypothetical protein
LGPGASLALFGLLRFGGSWLQKYRI